MTQLEDPANLDRWNDPARRLITLILIRCGLRLGDACACRSTASSAMPIGSVPALPEPQDEPGGARPHR